MIYRILIIAFFLVGVDVASSAQTGLNIEELFNGQFRDDKNTTETIITGEPLYDYNLGYYHSLTFSDAQSKVDIIEPLVVRDGAKAVDKEVSYRGGKLYYAFYSLSPGKSKSGKNVNRYLFYLNQYAVGRDGLIIIYLSGSASREQVKNMLKK